MRKKILSIFLTIFMVMAFFPIKSKAITNYGLWIGGVEITSENMSDVLGDGTCNFDPESNTITLNNANITGSHENSNMYLVSSETSPLTILLKGTNSLSGAAYGIYSSNKNLTIDGTQGGTLNAQATATNLGTITVSNGYLYIKNVSNLNAENDNRPAIYTSFLSNLKIENSIVTTHSENYIALYPVATPLEISGNSIVTASTENYNKAVYIQGGSISLGEGIELIEPVGGTITNDNPHIYIKNSDGTDATRAVIGNGHLITATASPSGSGTITGAGAYVNNTTATLTATPAEGYRFVNWAENEEEVSTDATYSFTVTEGHNLVANFERVYTIKYVNYDGTVLQSSSIPYGGETPIYTGETPTKPDDENYTYTFAGWSPESSATVTDNATYTATYTQTTRKYNVTFTDDDDTELQSSSVPYGEIPVYDGEPTKPATAQYTYEFLAWSPAIVPVTTDAVYKATYNSTVNEYTIRFVNEDGTELQSSTLPYGETPVYTGETPTKPDDDQFTYTFAGWDPEIAEVTGDATYTGVYSAEDKTEHSKSESDDEDVSEITSDDEETPKSDVSKAETNESEISDAPNTGDKANVLPLTSLLIMSLLCLIFIFLKKKKYKYSK